VRRAAGARCRAAGRAVPRLQLPPHARRHAVACVDITLPHHARVPCRRAVAQDCCPVTGDTSAVSFILPPHDTRAPCRRAVAEDSCPATGCAPTVYLGFAGDDRHGTTLTTAWQVSPLPLDPYPFPPPKRL